MKRPLITYLGDIPLLGMFLNYHYHNVLQQKRTMINEFLGRSGLKMDQIMENFLWEYTVLPADNRGRNKGLPAFAFYVMLKRAKEKDSVLELEELCKKIRNEHNEKLWKRGYF